MRQQSFLGRVCLDITEREKSHPIIYITKIGKVSDVNAIRLARPCPSAVLMICEISCFHINAQRKSFPKLKNCPPVRAELPLRFLPCFNSWLMECSGTCISSTVPPLPQAPHLKDSTNFYRDRRHHTRMAQLFEEPSHCWCSSAHEGEFLFPPGKNKAKKKRNCNEPQPLKITALSILKLLPI